MGGRCPRGQTPAGFSRAVCGNAAEVPIRRGPRRQRPRRRSVRSHVAPCRFGSPADAEQAPFQLGGCTGCAYPPYPRPIPPANTAAAGSPLPSVLSKSSSIPDSNECSPFTSDTGTPPSSPSSLPPPSYLCVPCARGAGRAGPGRGLSR
jgi:hypothetical protein